MARITLPDKDTQDAILSDTTELKALCAMLARQVTLSTVNTNVSSILATINGVYTYCSRIDTNVKALQTGLGTSADAANQSGTTVFSLLKYVASKL